MSRNTFPEPQPDSASYYKDSFSHVSSQAKYFILDTRFPVFMYILGSVCISRAGYPPENRDFWSMILILKLKKMEDGILFRFSLTTKSYLELIRFCQSKTKYTKQTLSCALFWLVDEIINFSRITLLKSFFYISYIFLNKFFKEQQKNRLKPYALE